MGTGMLARLCSRFRIGFYLTWSALPLSRVLGSLLVNLLIKLLSGLLVDVGTGVEFAKKLNAGLGSCSQNGL